MHSGLGGQQDFLPKVQISSFSNGEGYRKWSLWYLFWNDMIGMVGGYSDMVIGMAWFGGVYGWCVLQMQLPLIGWSAGLGEKVVRYNWLVEKLIIRPCVCRKLIPNTTGKRIFLVTRSCI